MTQDLRSSHCNALFAGQAEQSTVANKAIGTAAGTRGHEVHLEVTGVSIEITMIKPNSGRPCESELRWLYRRLGADVDNLIDKIPSWEVSWVLSTLKEFTSSEGFKKMASNPARLRSGLEMLLDVL